MTRPSLVDANFLRGNWASFSPAERELRKKYVDLVLSGLLVPRPEWLVDRGDFVSGDAGSLLATGIYNVLADSRETEDLLPAGGLRQIIETGGDAELWSLIRVALIEAPDDEFVAVCRERGFRVFKTKGMGST